MPYFSDYVAATANKFSFLKELTIEQLLDGRNKFEVKNELAYFGLIQFYQIHDKLMFSNALLTVTSVFMR